MFPIFQAVASRPSLSDLWKMTLRGDEMTSVSTLDITNPGFVPQFGVALSPKKFTFWAVSFSNALHS